MGALRLVAVLAVLGLLVVACGGEDASESEAVEGQDEQVVASDMDDTRTATGDAVDQSAADLEAPGALDDPTLPTLTVASALGSAATRPSWATWSAAGPRDAVGSAETLFTPEASLPVRRQRQLRFSGYPDGAPRVDQVTATFYSVPSTPTTSVEAWVGWKPSESVRVVRLGPRSGELGFVVPVAAGRYLLALDVDTIGGDLRYGVRLEVLPRERELRVCCPSGPAPLRVARVSDGAVVDVFEAMYDPEEGTPWFGRERWAPDGSGLAVVDARGVWLIRAGTWAVEQLWEGTAHAIAWAPNGVLYIGSDTGVLFVWTDGEVRALGETSPDAGKPVNDLLWQEDTLVFVGPGRERLSAFRFDSGGVWTSGAVIHPDALRFRLYDFVDGVVGVLSSGRTSDAERVYLFHPFEGDGLIAEGTPDALPLGRYSPDRSVVVESDVVGGEPGGFEWETTAIDVATGAIIATFRAGLPNIAFSADGQSFFLARDPCAPTEVLQAASLNGSVRTIAVNLEGTHVFAAHWSPDEQQVLIAGPLTRWVAPIDGSGPARVILEDVVGSAPDGGWSPDGAYVAAWAWDGGGFGWCD